MHPYQIYVVLCCMFSFCLCFITYHCAKLTSQKKHLWRKPKHKTEQTYAWTKERWKDEKEVDAVVVGFWEFFCRGDGGVSGHIPLELFFRVILDREFVSIAVPLSLALVSCYHLSGIQSQYGLDWVCSPTHKKDINISVRTHGTKGSIFKYNIAKGTTDQSLVTK